MKELEHRRVERKRIIYLNFEDERLELSGGYDRIIDAYLSLYPDGDLSICYLFFDEIQELPGWEKFIRRVYDTHTRHIFLTGSNARFLSTEIATALRGRSLSFEIMPLSFRQVPAFVPEFKAQSEFDAFDESFPLSFPPSFFPQYLC